MEDDRPAPRRQLRRGQELHRLGRHALRVGGQPQRTDVLVAGTLPAAARIREAAALQLVAVHRVRLDAGADVRDDLLGVAAVGRRERLPFALGAVGGVGERDPVDPPHRRVRGEQVADLGLKRDAERIFCHRRLESTMGRWPAVEHNGPPDRGGGRASDPDGLGRDSVRLGGREDVAGREAPRPVDEDADPESLALVDRDAGQRPALDVDRLFEAPDDPHVGVRRSPGSGGVERPVSDLAHPGTVAGVSGPPRATGRGCPPPARTRLPTTGDRTRLPDAG